MLEHAPLAPLIVLAVYVVGTICFVPVSLMIAVTGAIFGTAWGLVYAMVGSLLGAAASYAIGSLLGPNALRRVGGARVELLSQRLGREGLKAMLVIRLVPVAPFVVINVVAGASHIRLRDFMLGTALGMAPGILAKVVFADQIAQAVLMADLSWLRTLLVIAIVAVVVAFIVRRYWGGRVAALVEKGSGSN